MRTLPLVLTLTVSSLLPAQAPTPTAVFDAPGSQANVPAACLVMQAAVQSPGALNAAFPGFLGLFSPSRTFAYTSDGTVTGEPPGVLTYLGMIEGGSLMPFMLVVEVVATGIPCGSGTPCLAGGSLFGSTATPFGTYHLSGNALVLIDGIAGLAPPGALNVFGRFPLGGAFDVDTVANGGQERRLGLQVLVADPGAPSGFSLSACLNVDQWVL